MILYTWELSCNCFISSSSSFPVHHSVSSINNNIFNIILFDMQFVFSQFPYITTLWTIIGKIDLLHILHSVIFTMLTRLFSWIFNFSTSSHSQKIDTRHKMFQIFRFSQLFSMSPRVVKPWRWFNKWFFRASTWHQ